MKILGIETSCDETAAAVVEGTAIDRKVIVLSQAVASSQEFHQNTGGIVPEVAARKQIELLLPVLSEALHKIRLQDIDAIAVTAGPGLSGSLLVGVETARVLALAWGKPLLAVNHLVAHLYANWVGVKSKSEARNSKQFRNLKSQNTNTKIPEFPALGLVVSGGHTDLVLMHSHEDIERMGSTRDDAAGEAFDKIARMLGLAYPGGPAIAAEAEKFKIQNSKFKISLPRPMMDSEDYDYSFSGLKTAVMRQLSGRKPSGQLVRAIAQEAQEAICEVLITKLARAINEYRPKSVLVAGGVAANRRLRQRLKFEIPSKGATPKVGQAGRRNLKFEIALFIPPVELCTDNAASVAASAFYRFSPTPWTRVAIDPGLTIAE